MASYKERQEQRAREAKIAGSRSRGDARKKMSEYMGRFKAKMGGVKDRMGAFRDRMAQPPQQKFGTSALQQAMYQQQSGNMTPQAQELMDYHMAQNPTEMNRQSQLMGSGIHGDYGMNRQAQPMYTNATTNLLAGDEQGPPESLTSSPVTMDAMIQNNKTEGVNQLLDLHKNMKDLPQSTSEIEAMQTRLNSLGYTDMHGNKLAVDGKIGKLTTSAMEKFKNKHSTDTGEALDPEKVVSGVNRDFVAGAEEGAYSPQQAWNPYAMETQSEWDIANQGHGGQAGYHDIQQTIGNPANDPVMWGMDEFTNPLQSLQYDGDNEVPYHDYIGPRPPR